MENEAADIQKRRQRFSISGLFYKASRDRKRSSACQQSSEEGAHDIGMATSMNSHNISFDDDFTINEMNQYSTDGPQKMPTMRDQDQMVQELKKENFDLKLRLYMTQKNSENNEGKVSEYEQQLGAILNRFEEQQKIFEQQTHDLAEARQTEKSLLRKQRKLESDCKMRDEKIQNLSMSLSQLSTSMTNLSSPRHYTPSRVTHSMYFDTDEEEEVPDGYDSEHPINSTQVSRVAPMRRDIVATSSFHDEVRLVENECDDNSRNSFVSTSSDITPHITKNIYNTTINNPQTGGAFDNVGIVKPNNSRTVVDVEVAQNRGEEPTQQKKKKRKGFLNVFKLCSGKSGQAMAREESIYHKKPARPARVTMTTYNNNNNNNTE